MKALSVRQPWASLLVYGFKPVENRDWGTRYRGPLLIHASKTVDKEAMDWLWQHNRELGLTHGWNLLPFRTGGIVGQVELYDVTQQPTPPPIKAGISPVTGAFVMPERWYFGPFGWWVHSAQELPFRPLRGKLGLFNVELP